MTVVAVSSSALFFAALMTEPAMIASVDFTSSRLSPSSRSFSMPLPGLPGLNWLMSTCLMTFCNNSRMALCVYWPCLLVCSHFVDSAEDLLLGRGQCHVAGFRHGGIRIFSLD